MFSTSCGSAYYGGRIFFMFDSDGLSFTFGWEQIELSCNDRSVSKNCFIFLHGFLQTAVVNYQWNLSFPGRSLQSLSDHLNPFICSRQNVTLQYPKFLLSVEVGEDFLTGNCLQCTCKCSVSLLGIYLLGKNANTYFALQWYFLQDKVRSTYIIVLAFAINISFYTVFSSPQSTD